MDSLGVEYGTVELRHVDGGVVRYRAAHRGQVIGNATTLRLACERVHGEYLRAMGPGYKSAAPTPEELAERRR